MHIAIIGNGIAGITTARHIRKHSDAQITVISAETDFFFSRTALMYIYMGHMKFEHTEPYERSFWQKNRIALKRAYVERVDFDQKILHFTEETNPLHYDTLVLACGSKPNKFGWRGQDLEGVGGLYSYQDLAYMETHSKGLQRAVVVGGGLIGIEMAEMFASRHIPVTFLVREASFWRSVLPREESEMINRHIAEHHIDLRLATELTEILPDAHGKVRAVRTNHEEEIPCQFVGLTAGVHPNIEFVRNSALKTDRGILVNEYFETNLPGVYAIGDCAQFRKALTGLRPHRTIEQVWYTGRMHGETVAQTIIGNRTPYTPGIWFNSAKFFDIEYQTYGMVLPELDAQHDALYWEHPKGKKAVRIVFRKEDMAVRGFNLMGIRFRHEVCDRWLRQEAPLAHVLQHLQEANFDPEFFKPYEREIIAEYEKKFPGQTIATQRRKRFLEYFGL